MDNLPPLCSRAAIQKGGEDRSKGVFLPGRQRPQFHLVLSIGSVIAERKHMTNHLTCRNNGNVDKTLLRCMLILLFKKWMAHYLHPSTYVHWIFNRPTTSIFVTRPTWQLHIIVSINYRSPWAGSFVRCCQCYGKVPTAWVTRNYRHSELILLMLSPA